MSGMKQKKYISQKEIPLKSGELKLGVTLRDGCGWPGFRQYTILASIPNAAPAASPPATKAKNNYNKC